MDKCTRDKCKYASTHARDINNMIQNETGKKLISMTRYNDVSITHGRYISRLVNGEGERKEREREKKRFYFLLREEEHIRN